MPKDQQPPAQATPPAKRRWRRRLGWIMLVLVVFGLLLNGPLFRWGAKFGLQKVLAKQEITGPFSVHGSIWSGAELSKVDWISAKDGTKLTAEHAHVHYEPARWFRDGLPGILRSIELRKVNAVIDLTKPTLKPTKPKPAPSGPPKPLPVAQLPQPDIKLEDVTITLLLPEHRQLVCERLNLSVAGNQPGVIEVRSLTLPDGQVLNLNASLVYTETGIALSDCKVFPEVTIDQLELKVTADRDLQGLATLSAYGGTVESTLMLGQQVNLQLTKGALELAKALPELPIEGRVSELQVSIENLYQPWHQWKSTIDTTIDTLAYDQFQLASARVKLQADDEWSVISELQLDSNNALTVKGAVLNPSPSLDWKQWDSHAEIRAGLVNPAAWMKQCQLPVSLNKVVGTIEAAMRHGEIQSVKGKLDVGPLHKTPWLAPPMTLTADTGGGNLPHTIVLTSGEFLTVNTQWNSRFTQYEGNLVAEIQNLSSLQEASASNSLVGAVQAHWEGGGSFATKAHQGTLKLNTNNIGPASSNLVYEGDLELDYTPDALSIQSLRVALNELRLALVGTLTESGLTIPKLTLHRQDAEWLSGTITMPLTEAENVADRFWNVADRFWNAESPVAIDIHSIDMPLADLVRVAGQEDPQLAGTLRLDAAVEGLPRELNGRISLIGRQLGSPSESPFPTTGDLDFELTARDGQANLKGELRHPHLEPVEIMASVPFQPRAPADAAQAPIVASLKVPPTELGFVKDYVSSLRQLTGTFAADVHVGGTTNKPEILGEVTLDIPRVQFTSLDQPDLTNTKVVVVVKGLPNTLTIKEAHTQFADGRVDLFGSVEMSDLKNPTLALQLKAAQALLARDERMIVRGDATISITGPWEQASVQGIIDLVESRYFQEIDLLPTNRPSTSVPSSPFTVEKTYGTEALPFKDWTIDLTLRTDEPFRVRTNLAAADIVADLRLSGTGQRVVPNGSITLTDAYAQLPFSRLDLAQTAIRFNEQTGFLGALDVRGESRIRNYRTRVAVKGNLNNFDVVLTSSPPMPEEEIMALLATGTTREELVGNSDVAASRAALLLFDKIWRKIAKKDWEDPSAMREKRLTFESGQVNPRTGRTMTTARLRLTDHVSITGDADIEGDFRGLLQYLFRF